MLSFETIKKLLTSNLPDSLSGSGRLLSFSLLPGSGLIFFYNLLKSGSSQILILWIRWNISFGICYPENDRNSIIKNEQYYFLVYKNALHKKAKTLKLT